MPASNNLIGASGIAKNGSLAIPRQWIRAFGDLLLSPRRNSAALGVQFGAYCINPKQGGGGLGLRVKGVGFMAEGLGRR